MGQSGGKVVPAVTAVCRRRRGRPAGPNSRWPVGGWAGCSGRRWRDPEEAAFVCHLTGFLPVSRAPRPLGLLLGKSVCTSARGGSVQCVSARRAAGVAWARVAEGGVARLVLNSSCHFVAHVLRPVSQPPGRSSPRRESRGVVKELPRGQV